ncbi:MAG: hypothetical protein RIQ89_329 [Bacteroidota bacterium]|jgi:protein SCO1
MSIKEKKTGRRLVVISLVILFGPALFWILLTRGHNNYKSLPYFGPIEIGNNGDTSYHTIPIFSGLDQTGKLFSSDSLKGKVYIANFFFASCPGICPKMNALLRKVQEEFRGNQEVAIVSFTVNPEEDSASVLYNYAQQLNANHQQWHFLNSPFEEVKQIAEKGFFAVTRQDSPDPDGISHSPNLFLVDKEQRIRAIRDGLERKEVDSIIAEVKVLLLEYREKKN